MSDNDQVEVKDQELKFPKFTVISNKEYRVLLNNIDPDAYCLSSIGGVHNRVLIDDLEMIMDWVQNSRIGRPDKPRKYCPICHKVSYTLSMCDECREATYEGLSVADLALEVQLWDKQLALAKELLASIKLKAQLRRARYKKQKEGMLHNDMI